MNGVEELYKAINLKETKEKNNEKNDSAEKRIDNFFEENNHVVDLTFKKIMNRE